jgi:hypothetical protein
MYDGKEKKCPPVWSAGAMHGVSIVCVNMLSVINASITLKNAPLVNNHSNNPL